MADELTNTQEKTAKEAKQQAEYARRMYLKDLRHVFKDSQGQRLMWALLAKTQMFNTVYTGHPEDTIYAEGQRSVGRELLQDLLDVDEDAFTKMVGANKLFSKE